MPYASIQYGADAIGKVFQGSTLLWEKPAVGGGTYADEVLADNPVGYWRLEETSGTTAADATGNGHTGTVSGADLAVTGAVGSAAGFNGSGNHIDVGKLGTLTTNLGTNLAMTVEFFARWSGTGLGFIFGTVDTGSNTIIQAMVNSNGQESVVNGALAFAIWDDDRFRHARVTSGTSYNDGVWRHFAFTWTLADTVKVYVNGVDDTGVDHNTGSPDNFNLVDWPFYWGARNVRGSAGTGKAHDLDEMAVYDYSLSPARILAHAQAAGVA